MMLVPIPGMLSVDAEIEALIDRIPISEWSGEIMTMWSRLRWPL